SHESKQLWWSHDLYRGPRNQKPKVLYARSKAESEEIARGFSQEQVLGFDMEWPSYDGTNSQDSRLQDRIGVIAMACEDKIALFHLGAYTGKSPSDFIGPVLRALIESPVIMKAGVNILAADFRRLQEYLGLQPQGAVELSHLHNLVTHGATGEFSMCTTKLCALGEQVQTHLGLPLKKSSVRTSNWSQRKQLTREQKSYAASDAYAGFMLYHYLNYMRLSMEPKPPLPLYAEKYRFVDLPRSGTALLLQLDDPGDRTSLKVIRAVDFFQGRHGAIHTIDIVSQSTQAALEPMRSGRSGPSPRKTKPSRRQPQSLIHKLKAHRERIAKQRRLDTWKIIHNSALDLIATHRPENETALMRLKGAGPQTVKKYGAAILNIVAIHVEQE
ncbi:ribonuclease H-like domain-containing protein, partial [Diaporthe sp. PMI_573]